MKYQHRFHAGNFADVHKHITLIAILEAMRRKDAGLLFIDTHAGSGRYELARGEPAAESNDGIEALLAADPAPQAEEISRYVQLVTTDRQAHGPHSYAGSPLIANRLLRPQDRAVFCDLEPEAVLALRRELAVAAGAPLDERYQRVQHADGFKELNAWLPPRERRGLLLIDPPFENAQQDFSNALAALDSAQRKFATGVAMFWYPIKNDTLSGRFLRQLAGALTRPWLQAELWRFPRDNRVSLNGSGLAIVNPPYLLEERMREWLPQLHFALAGEAGGWRIERHNGV